MTRPKRPKASKYGSQMATTLCIPQHIVDRYADDMDAFLRDEVLPVLHEIRQVLRNAVASMPPDTVGALKLVIVAHNGRIAKLNALIGSIEERVNE